MSKNIELVEVTVMLYEKDSRADSEDDHEMWLKPFDETFQIASDQNFGADLSPESGGGWIRFKTEPDGLCVAPNAGFSFRIIGAGTGQYAGGIDCDLQNTSVYDVFDDKDKLLELYNYAVSVSAKRDKDYADSLTVKEGFLRSLSISNLEGEAKERERREKEKTDLVRFVTAWKFCGQWSSNIDYGEEWDQWYELLGVVDMENLPITPFHELSSKT